MKILSHASNDNRGIALISALIIVALVGITAGNIAWNNTLDLRRTMTHINHNQAIQVALGAESWVATILKNDRLLSETDHLDEIWATNMPIIPVEGGMVSGYIEDLQGRFNINNLITENGKVNQSSLNQFQRLLSVLGINQNIALMTLDWLDYDQYPSFPEGAEDNVYINYNPPYLNGGQRIISTSELSALHTMNKEIFYRLSPYITALPRQTAINVNTANEIIMQSISENITPDDAKSLVIERMNGGFRDIENTFTSIIPLENINNVSLSSNYFGLKLQVRIDNVNVILYSIFERRLNGDVTPILRTFGAI